jgi:hypothetical protein
LTLRTLTAALIAGTIAAAPVAADAACGINQITNNNRGKTYQFLSTVQLYDNEIPCGAEPFGACPGVYATEVTRCTWRAHQGNIARGTANVRVTCGQPRPPDLGGGQQEVPDPFWLDQDQPFQDWNVLNPPRHQLQRIGNSCDYRLVDLNNPGEPGTAFGEFQHPPYEVTFGSAKADTVIVFGGRSDPADRGDNYGLLEFATGLH